MKKNILFLFICIALVAPIAAFANQPSRNRAHKTSAVTKSKTDKSDSIYNSVSQLYQSGKISADSVVNAALYHKLWSPELAVRCLKLVTDHTPRSAMELGAIYAFSPEFSSLSSDGVKLLEESAKAGLNEANCYLGLYYFNQKDYTKAKQYFDACKPMKYGIGHTALGSMYLEGKGVKESGANARENYKQAALEGYPRGMSLYGNLLNTKNGGELNYPDAFFWYYIAGDLGENYSRVMLYRPMLPEKPATGKVAQDAQLALKWIEMVHKGKNLKDEPIYKNGFLQSLKSREKAAEEGDDWARLYLGSMNYNGDFLNQNYTQALHYYEPIAQNGKLPKTVLALVHERLAKMYGEGKGTKADPAKAAKHTRLAAQYGSLPSYLVIENITE